MPKRPKRPLGRFRNAAYDEALARQRAQLLAMVPEPRRHRVLGRRIEEFKEVELAALTRTIQGYIDSHCCRLTSSDAPTVD